MSLFDLISTKETDRSEVNNETNTNPNAPAAKVVPFPTGSAKSNHFLHGSRLKGDIVVTCDLELSGEVVGNISSKENSSIFMKGSCKGNIETAGGNVHLEGELSEGNIRAGGDVHVTGKFFGGSIIAGGKCYINGEVTGTLEATDIEIGPDAKFQGEIHYRGSLSIIKGAQVQSKLTQCLVEAKPEPIKVRA